MSIDFSKIVYSEEYQKYLDGLTEEKRNKVIQEYQESILNNRKNLLIEKINGIRKKRDELLQNFSKHKKLLQIKIFFF